MYFFQKGIKHFTAYIGIQTYCTVPPRNLLSNKPYMWKPLLHVRFFENFSQVKMFNFNFTCCRIDLIQIQFYSLKSFWQLFICYVFVWTLIRAKTKKNLYLNSYSFLCILVESGQTSHFKCLSKNARTVISIHEFDIKVKRLPDICVIVVTYYPIFVVDTC